MSVDYAAIYARHAREYDALISAEDCDHNLLPALRSLCAVDGISVLDVGAGTGRLTRLLAPYARRVVAVDRAPAMIDVARARMEGASNVAFHVADASKLPCETASAELCVAGWVFGHLRHWMPDGWRDEIAKCLAEMDRVSRPGGTVVVIETLGTGSTEPRAPNASLAEYYHWLETVQGFTRAQIRTDYEFASVQESAQITGFFFGDDFARRVIEHGWRRVPECTGVWSRKSV